MKPSPYTRQLLVLYKEMVFTLICMGNYYNVSGFGIKFINAWNLA